jgi:hypothetical protein
LGQTKDYKICICCVSILQLINIDSINSLIKWKSEVGEINLENVFENISVTTNDIKLRNFQSKVLSVLLSLRRSLISKPPFSKNSL